MVLPQELNVPSMLSPPLGLSTTGGVPPAGSDDRRRASALRYLDWSYSQIEICGAGLGFTIAWSLLIRALEMTAWPRLAMKTVTDVGLVSVQLETG